MSSSMLYIIPIVIGSVGGFLIVCSLCNFYFCFCVNLLYKYMKCSCKICKNCINYLYCANPLFISCKKISIKPPRIKWIVKLRSRIRKTTVANAILEEDCSICFEPIDYKKLQLLGCGHFYHYECIDHWSTIHNICPQCREEISYRPNCIQRV